MYSRATRDRKSNKTLKTLHYIISNSVHTEQNIVFNMLSSLRLCNKKVKNTSQSKTS